VVLGPFSGRKTGSAPPFLKIQQNDLHFWCSNPLSPFSFGVNGSRFQKTLKVAPP